VLALARYPDFEGLLEPFYYSSLIRKKYRQSVIFEELRTIGLPSARGDILS
jgi:hypothetical protein